MLVPSQTSQESGGIDERMLSPGAVTSGFICSEIGVGPLDENDAISSAGPSVPSLDAATVIACGALAGLPTEPRPASV